MFPQIEEHGDLGVLNIGKPYASDQTMILTFSDLRTLAKVQQSRPGFHDTLGAEAEHISIIQIFVFFFLLLLLYCAIAHNDTEDIPWGN